MSFTGELGYEINVPAHYGRAVWEAAWREVEQRGGCAYGTEAMHVLRAEKGYIIVGQETDGTVTPADLGLDWAIGKAKKDFVGKRSLARPDMLAANRKQLVGLLTDDPAIVLEEGAQVTESANPPTGTPALGHVTSSYRERHSRPLDRARARRRGTLAHRRQAQRPDAGRRNSGDRHGAGLLRQTGSAPPCLTRRSTCVRRSKALPFPWGRDSPCRRRRRPPVSSCAAARAPASLAASPSARSRRWGSGRRARAPGRAALWLGPDEWLMIADGADPAPLGETLESVLDGTAHSLVDVSHRQIGLIASGPAAARVLNAGCPLDLDLAAFPLGMATRTLYDKAEIVLWRRAETRFHVEVWRSFAPHVAASLGEAAKGAADW